MSLIFAAKRPTRRQPDPGLITGTIPALAANLAVAAAKITVGLTARFPALLSDATRAQARSRPASAAAMPRRTGIGNP